VEDSPACNPNRPAPLITAVITNPTRANHTVTVVPQFHLTSSSC